MTRAGKAIVRFAIVAPLCYAALVAAWPLVRVGYTAVYRGTGNVIFAEFAGARVSLDALENSAASSGRAAGTNGQLQQAAASRDTQITIINPRTGTRGRLGHSAYITGYLSSALLLALISATPAGWRRQLIAAVVGLVLLHAFVQFRLLATLLHVLSGPPPMGLISHGQTLTAAYARAHELLAVSPLPSFIAPVIVWVLVAVRRGDILELLSDAQAASARPPRAKADSRHLR